MNAKFVCKGLDELINKLDHIDDDPKFKNALKKAVEKGAQHIAKSVQSSLDSVSDRGYSKGYTANEIQVTRASIANGRIGVKIHWNGPHERYKIVHLNEFGYSKDGKTYHPPMFGKIKAGIDSSEKEALNIVKTEVQKGVNTLGK